MTVYVKSASTSSTCEVASGASDLFTKYWAMPENIPDGRCLSAAENAPVEVDMIVALSLDAINPAGNKAPLSLVGGLSGGACY
jgi:hypothetical protein